jgi:large subunit ribosomal protein L25
MATKRIELEITPREVTGKATRRLRKAGFIRGNIYGRKKASQPIQVEAHAFDLLRRSHGTRHVLALKPQKGTSQTALIRHVQLDPVNRTILHIDFLRVSMDDQITVKIPLRLVGEAPAVKLEGGMVLHLLDAVEVRCKASEIAEALELDISPLTEIDATLRASDVPLPANYTLVTDAAEPVVKIASPRTEAAPTEEPEAAVASPAAGPVETAEPAAASEAEE